MTMAQVVPVLGAGVACFGRRCAFTLWTCVTTARRMSFHGAGPHPFSTPAPTPPYTCASKALHLRRQGPDEMFSWKGICERRGFNVSLQG